MMSHLFALFLQSSHKYFNCSFKLTITNHKIRHLLSAIFYQIYHCLFELFYVLVQLLTIQLLFAQWWFMMTAFLNYFWHYWWYYVLHDKDIELALSH
jgi:hypothetical protein